MMDVLSGPSFNDFFRTVQAMLLAVQLGDWQENETKTKMMTAPWNARGRMSKPARHFQPMCSASGGSPARPVSIRRARVNLAALSRVVAAPLGPEPTCWSELVNQLTS